MQPRTWSSDAVAGGGMDRTSGATSPVEGSRDPSFTEMRPPRGDVSAQGTRSWKRPASANESERRPDRKHMGHQQLGGSDNERDRRYHNMQQIFYSIFLLFLK